MGKLYHVEINKALNIGQTLRSEVRGQEELLLIVDKLPEGVWLVEVVEGLMDCPFCGSKPSVERKSGRGWFVICNDFTCVQHIYGHPTRQDAIDSWNRRM